MRLQDRIRIIMEQPRRPQRGVKVVTLGLQLGGQAAIQHDRARFESLRECSEHQPNLASSA